MFVVISYHVGDEACGALVEGVGWNLARYKGEEFESHDCFHLGVGSVGEPAVSVDLLRGEEKWSGGGEGGGEG